MWHTKCMNCRQTLLCSSAFAALRCLRRWTHRCQRFEKKDFFSCRFWWMFSWTKQHSGRLDLVLQLFQLLKSETFRIQIRPLSKRKPSLCITLLYTFVLSWYTKRQTFTAVSSSTTRDGRRPRWSSAELSPIRPKWWWRVSARICSDTEMPSKVTGTLPARFYDWRLLALWICCNIRQTWSFLLEHPLRSLIRWSSPTCCKPWILTFGRCPGLKLRDFFEVGVRLEAGEFRILPTDQDEAVQKLLESMDRSATGKVRKLFFTSHQSFLGTWMPYKVRCLPNFTVGWSPSPRQVQYDDFVDWLDQGYGVGFVDLGDEKLEGCSSLSPDLNSKFKWLQICGKRSSNSWVFLNYYSWYVFPNSAFAQENQGLLLKPVNFQRKHEHLGVTQNHQKSIAVDAEFSNLYVFGITIFATIFPWAFGGDMLPGRLDSTVSRNFRSACANSEGKRWAGSKHSIVILLQKHMWESTVM